MPKSKYLTTLLITVAALFFILPALATVYTDWLWFQEIALQQVFMRTITARAALGAMVFLAVFAVLFLNLKLMQGALKERAFTVFGPQGARTISVDLRRFRPLFFLGAILAAVLIAASASGKWQVWLMARNAVSFGVSDPILGRDVAFYLFQLPFLQFLHNLAFITVLVAAIAVAAAHFASQSLALDPNRGLKISAGARRHLSVLAAALLALLAFKAWLGIPELLTTASGAVHGASYVDVHARMPTQWILAGVALIGVALALYQVIQPRLWPIAAAVGRSAADSRGHRAERGHARQRAAVGRAAAARHLWADPGDPHLL
jgi:uncharacterized membrane protein (UPF0182 family)